MSRDPVGELNDKSLKPTSKSIALLNYRAKSWNPPPTEIWVGNQIVCGTSRDPVGELSDKSLKPFCFWLSLAVGEVAARLAPAPGLTTGLDKFPLFSSAKMEIAYTGNAVLLSVELKCRLRGNFFEAS